MKLRNGKQYRLFNKNDIKKVVFIQSLIRGYIVKTNYNDILVSIKIIHTKAPHLYKYHPRKKKKQDEFHISQEMIEIREQYDTMKYMGYSTNRRGIRRSTRKNKGKNPEKYIDDDFVEIFLEGDNYESIINSDNDDNEDIYSSEEDLESISDNFIKNDIVSDESEDDEWIPSDIDNEDY